MLRGVVPELPGLLVRMALPGVDAASACVFAVQKETLRALSAGTASTEDCGRTARHRHDSV